ncbi:hypothetical protein MMC09_002296 [Bachmanniomyces sp. S44760]|nr:hypothetical protein [Bachmanniomyces sp. S44760]
MSSVSSNSASLSRYRPAILAFTALAAGCGIYYIHTSIWSSTSNSSSSSRGLRRRNAIHRSDGRRQHHSDPSQAQPEAMAGSSEAQMPDRGPLIEGHGFYALTDAQGVQIEVSLAPSLIPTVGHLQEQLGFSEDEAAETRRQLEVASWNASFTRQGRTGYDSEFDSPELINSFLALGFSIDNIRSDIERINDGRSSNFETSQHAQVLAQQAQGNISREDQAYVSLAEEYTTNVELESEHSWREGEPEGIKKEGQSLLNLLYYIAEDQARRDGYVHRSVTCNGCNTVPIRGIRYRCANCVDFDLCEQCEAVQAHPKTHLFYKIRIPAPFLGNPRQPQPVWYPGKPTSLPQHLPRGMTARFCRETAFENAEVDALWDQFRCLAATEWVNDPNHFELAIDRRTFDKCFVPNASNRLPAPNMIYDRMFAFYDTNGDGLIGFEEFLKGIASLHSKNKDERMKRIFQGYDINRDGFVERKDFLRMFRAFYALTKELTRDMVTGMEEDAIEGGSARDIVMSSQPISSAFSGAIPLGEQSRTGQGKTLDENGDFIVNDDNGVVRETEQDEGNHHEIIGDVAETAVFGGVDVPKRNHWDSMLPQADSSGDDEASAPDFQAYDSDQSDQEPGNENRKENGSEKHGDWRPWPPNGVQILDVEAALGGYIAINDIEDPNDRIKVIKAMKARQARELYTKRQALRKEAINERWRRREFYLDEEDGSRPPEGVDGVDGDDGEPARILTTPKKAAFVDDTPPESSEPSRRSRSSSKVRFEDDLTDANLETRSNTSMSSRSIPIGERWGGYEIPEAEKDVGREVLYQVTQEGLNELLDPLFQNREDLAMEVARSRSERRKWQFDIEQYTTSQKEMAEKNLWLLACFQKDWRLAEDISSLSAGKPAGLQSSVHDDILNYVASNADREMPEEHKTSASTEDSLQTTSVTSSEPKGPAQDQSPAEQLEPPNIRDESVRPSDVYTDDNEYPPPAEDLHSAVRIFNEADPTLEEGILQKPIDTLLQESGYSVIDSAPAPLSEPLAPLSSNPVDIPDPTLPQNRPNAPLPISTPPRSTTDPPDPVPNPPPRPESAKSTPASRLAALQGTEAANDGPPATSSPPSKIQLRYWAMIEQIEKEDAERGGPGRLSFGEFEEIMKGPRGVGLGFVGAWIDVANF